ncbi:hypothetical protein K435DRAFT_879293 [Dendrothele bispora CBS 962.96]|uniref:Uncharacterized protein n=1 Tax=Dendrothele bispora (strain CBS 962.96) TaxID=1314807 RepID=A0A4S8KLG6_DENBC|nr:hypothetical protein K435DRAFT_879293 [Dendrothele bispora CBS 962.96]
MASLTTAVSAFLKVVALGYFLVFGPNALLFADMTSPLFHSSSSYLSNRSMHHPFLNVVNL